MPINMDFIGLNTFLNEPLSSSSGQNVLGYPSGTSLSAYENVDVVRIDSGNTAPANATSVMRRRQGQAAIFHALNTKRNGPYGFGSWQQLRVGDNPLTRYHNKNSDFTFVTNNGETRTTLTDTNKEVPRKDTYSKIHQYEEPSVTSKTFPLIWNVGLHEKINDDEYFLNRFSLKSSYSNYLLAFSNDQVNNHLGTKIDDDDLEYHMIKSLYISGGLDDEGSPITHWEFLKYRETIFPRAQYAYRKENRRRQNYYSAYRTKRTLRTRYFLTNSFGNAYFDREPGSETRTLVINFSQSSWPLDTEVSWDSNATHRSVTIFTSSTANGSGDELLAHTPYPADGINTRGPGVGGAGVLMNNYSQFAYSLFDPKSQVNTLDAGTGEVATYYQIDYSMGIAPNYSRRHTLEATGSVSNPSGFANQRTGSGVNVSFEGNAKWEAADMANKQPFPDTYSDYASVMRLKAKDYTVLPEFRISNHVREILISGSSFRPPNLFEITGGESNNRDSSDDDFFKIYSTTDFLRHFDLINEHHEGFAESKVLTMRCKAVKKFLPYDGFYPCQRTVKLAEQFKESYLDFVDKDKIIILPGTNPQATAYTEAKQPKQILMTPLFSPGIMFNSIKSGVAVDFPIYTNGAMKSIRQSGSATSASSDADFPLFHTVPGTISNTMLGANFNTTYIDSRQNSADDAGGGVTASYGPLGYRVPFEAMLAPERYLSQRTIRCIEPHASGNLSSSVQWSGQGDGLYKLMANNFFAEVPNFFLHNQGFTSLVSKKQSEFKKVSADKKYSMRIKMYKSMDSKRLAVSSSNGSIYFPPQDIISSSNSPRESFTMYSRPSAFGPPSLGISGYHIDDHNLDQVWYGDRIHVTGSNRNNIHMDSRHGFNFPYTPPYYHGEAWMDIHVSFSAGGIKSVSEIFEAANNAVQAARVHKPLEYSRAVDVFARGHHLASSSYGYGPQSFFKNNINKNAMQLTASLNVFGEGALKSIDLLDDNSLQEVNLVVNTQEENEKRWVIQTKFETPMLNFNHLKDSGGTNSNITLPSTATSKPVVPIGMWHQYGKLPDINEGVFLQVTDIPDSWVESYATPQNSYFNVPHFIRQPYAPSQTGSLADLCGFSNEPVKLGKIAQQKEISEAVVAIPFIESNGRKSFFKLDPNSVQTYLTPALKNSSQLGLSVKQQIDKMKKYILPPNLDFVSNKTVTPIAMYIFEFKHTLSQQDLSDIWQNLPPDSIANQYQESTAIISHPLLQKELLGSGKSGNNKKAEYPSQLRWMVFKAKKRAANNYFEKVFDKNSNLGDTEFKRISKVSVDAFGNTTDIQFNWPYDFFSLVELVKIDAEIEFNNADYSNFVEEPPEIITVQAKPRSIKKIDQTLDPNKFRVSLADTDASPILERSEGEVLSSIPPEIMDEIGAGSTIRNEIDAANAALEQLAGDFEDLQQDLADGDSQSYTTNAGPTGPQDNLADPDSGAAGINPLNRPAIEEREFD
jgi:hypothetical protein